MPTSDTAKKFQRLVEDFINVSEDAIDRLNKEKQTEHKSALKEFEKLAGKEVDGKEKPEEPERPDEIDAVDVFNSDFDRIVTHTLKACEKYDKAFDDLIESRKGAGNEAGADKKPDSAKFVTALEHTADRVCDALENFALRVRADFIGAKDETGKELGEKMKRASNSLFTEVKKLDAEIDKASATELKRKPKEEKKIEIVPTKFLAEYTKASDPIFKEEKAKLAKEFKEAKAKDPKAKEPNPDPQLERALETLEEKLKRLDTNTVFEKVTECCDQAKVAIKNVLKVAENDKLTKLLDKLYAEIKKHDSYMFLLSRSR